LKKHIRIAGYQEFCLTKKDVLLNDNSVEVLEAINDEHFITEIGKYNLEINSDPLILGDNCFSEL
tara:strand:- start:785 stop:979 length:195 start_codon:yes stop_codon:yes gene_type:complete